MNKQTEALKMAIEALRDANIWVNKPDFEGYGEAIQACKEALASNCEALEQPAQEPVVLERDYNFMRDLAIGCEDAWNELHKQEPVAFTNADELEELKSGMHTCYMYAQATDDGDIPLYTHPKPSWQGLSDDEISELEFKYVDYELFDEGEYGTECNIYVKDFARAIEQALRSKNEQS